MLTPLCRPSAVFLPFSLSHFCGPRASRLFLPRLFFALPDLFFFLLQRMVLQRERSLFCKAKADRSRFPSGDVTAASALVFSSVQVFFLVSFFPFLLRNTVTFPSRPGSAPLKFFRLFSACDVYLRESLRLPPSHAFLGVSLFFFFRVFSLHFVASDSAF